MQVSLKIENQILVSTNCTSLISDTVNLHTVKFTFDDSWTGLSKIVTFKNKRLDVVKYSVLGTTNDTCIIPWETIVDSGDLIIYVEGTGTINELEIVNTTKMQKPIAIVESDKIENATSGLEPTPSLLTQLKQYVDEKIAGITNGSVSDEQLATAVENYLTTHPISGITTEQSNQLSSSYQHISNSSVHVTTSEKDSWNAKSTFSGNYNDLTNKPTITNGTDGVSPVVSSSKTGKITTVTIQDSTHTETITINDGADGIDGANGADGYTPVKGTDYWTTEDINSIKTYCSTYISTELLGGAS